MFAERNEIWGGSQRWFLQQHSRTSAPRCWGIRVEGNRIFTTWGQLNGALQEAVEQKQGVNVGKANEMTPEHYALDRAREMCRKKNWEGYRETDSSFTFLDPPPVAAVNFSSLDLSLCFYKPDNSMGAGITKKAEAGKVWYARKRNGLMYLLARGDDGPAMLYSRRMLRAHDDEPNIPWDVRFPHIVEVATSVMPTNSILLGELVMDRQGEDDFKHVQSVTKSLTQQSLADQAEKGRPAFYCWDVAFWNGQDLVSKAPVRERYELIHELDGGHIIQPVEYYDSRRFPTPQHAVDEAKARQWEGWVVVDPDGVYGDRAYNFKGKPDRPGSFCAKLKPEFEDDFIAVWDPDRERHGAFPGPTGERSTKERNGLGIKSVALYQYDSKGVLTYISNVSSGLTDEMKSSLARSDAWPQVWRVIYNERTYQAAGDETNALTFARFDARRDDKSPNECVNPELG